VHRCRVAGRCDGGRCSTPFATCTTSRCRTVVSARTAVASARRAAVPARIRACRRRVQDNACPVHGRPSADTVFSEPVRVTQRCVQRLSASQMRCRRSMHLDRQFAHLSPARCSRAGVRSRRPMCRTAIPERRADGASRCTVPRKSVALSQLCGQPAPYLRAPEVVLFRLPPGPPPTFPICGIFEFCQYANYFTAFVGN
jgi:hypothetical protein